MDLELVGMKSGTESISNSPTKNVIRYQMLEMILRLGAQKYFLRSKFSVALNALLLDQDKETVAEAIIFFMENDMMQFLQHFDTNSWRDKRLWKQETEIIIDDYKPILRELFQRYSGKKNMFGQDA